MINKVLLFDLGGVIINIDPLITIKNLKEKSNIKSNIFESIDYRFGEKESVIKNLFFDFEKGEINADLFRDKIREYGKKINDETVSQISTTSSVRQLKLIRSMDRPRKHIIPEEILEDQDNSSYF